MEQGADLLLKEYDADIPRAAADLIAKIDWQDVEKLQGVITALRALRAVLPASGR